MPNLLLGIALVFFSWTVCAMVLYGIGYLVSSGLGRQLKICRPTDSLWLGLAVLFTALQLWHFLLPVDWRASLVFVVVGGIGTALALVRRGMPKRLLQPPAVAFALICLPLCLLIADSALDAPVNFDSGMYHFQAIRWSNEFPIVPGLGNLNIQLAVNQSFFLFVAWLNVFPFFNQGFHIANSFLLVAALLPIVRLALQLLWRPRRATLDELFALFMVPVLLRQVASYDLHSPSPDLAVLVLSIVLFQRFVALVVEKSEGRRQADILLVVLAALSSLLITIKLSGAALATMALGIGWVISERRWSAAEPEGNARVVRKATAVCLLLPLLFWSARGLVLSGYPAFPLTVGALPVEWGVPLEVTKYKAFYIRNHPRIWRGPPPWQKALNRGWDVAIEGQEGSAAKHVAFLEEAMGGWKWVRPWAERTWNDPTNRWPVWILLSGVLVALLSLFSGAGRSRAVLGRRMLRDLILLLPPVAGVLFWFWSAPAPRFGTPFLWLLAVWLWAIAISRMQTLIDTAIAATLLNGAIAAVCISSFAVEPVVWIREVPTNGFRPVPEAAITKVVSRSGVKIRVPRKDRRCWDTPLPSSPYVDPALEFLHPDQGLAGGFKVSR